MLKHIPRHEYMQKTEENLRRYEAAGLSPAECMSDIGSRKAQFASDDGYADGVLVGGISLLLAGLICKYLARKELKQYSHEINAKLAYAMSVKPLTDFDVPSGEDEENREENTD